LSDHSLTFLEMAFRTDRHKRPFDPSGIGHNVGTCRDSITMFVVVREGTVQEIAFELDGCLNTNACANAVAEIAEGRDLELAWKITPEMVADYLQSLPEDHFHCAELAVGAFYKALADYRQNGRQPWRCAYRRTH
jgi:nitrogen fixation NifU-like protein